MFDVYSSQSIKTLDKQTIQHKQITSLELMEHAASVAWAHIIPKIQMNSKILVWCGKGNNGGDGWVIARLAKEAGYSVEVFDLGEKGTEEQQKNKKAFLKKNGKHYDFEKDERPKDNFDVHIDAILGIGVKGEVKGKPKKFIELLNENEGMKIAIDIPSGMEADVFETKSVFSIVDAIVTFHGYKRALLGKQCYEFSSPTVEVVDIGLVQSQYIEPELHNMRPNQPFPKRNKFDYKGSFGHTLLIGGNEGKGGAAQLMAKASLLVGCGWSTLATHEQNIIPVASAAPEVMTINLGSDFQFPEEMNSNLFDVIAIGPGMGTEGNSEKIIYEALQWKKKYVIDADGIRILAKHPLWIKKLKPKSTVFTPHLGELRALVGDFKSEDEMFDKARSWVNEFKQYLLIKGPYTYLITPSGKTYFNSTGNPGLGKAGSGDVLTGMIAGSISRHGLNIELGVRWGVFLHGLAADKAVCDYSEESLLPSTLINYISRAILSV